MYYKCCEKVHLVNKTKDQSSDARLSTSLLCACISQHDKIPVLGLTQFDHNLRPIGYLYVIFTQTQNGTKMKLLRI